MFRYTTWTKVKEPLVFDAGVSIRLPEPDANNQEHRRHIRIPLVACVFTNGAPCLLSPCIGLPFSAFLTQDCLGLSFLCTSKKHGAGRWT